MINKETVALICAGAFTLGSFTATAQTTEPAAAEPAPLLPGQPAAVPTLPTLPTAPLPAGATPSSVPGTVTSTLPVLPAPTLPGLAPLPGATASAATAAPTPPPIGSLTPDSAAVVASDTTASLPTSAAPSQLYTFLFIEDPDYGVVRHKFTADVAELHKEHQIQSLLEKRRNQQGGNQLGGGLAGLGMGGMDPLMAMDPAMGAAMDPTLMAAGTSFNAAGGQGIAGNSDALRAAAEWDFYYEQLEMYDRYVREKLIPNTESDDLPALEYTAANALQERQDLFESFQEAAIAQNNEDFNENKEFYERLQKREDRRIAYRQWLMHKQNEVAEWAKVWARNVFGTRWADGEEVRVDDWYYGTDFNSAEPVLVAIDNREYVVSRQPVGNLQDGQLNVISSNLTPYDIIDNNGYLKNPVMETQRGTIVIPPAGPVYTTESTTGTIEIIGSATE